MSHVPILLDKQEVFELLKIGLSKEDALELHQWQLLGRLVGSILMQVRESFIELDNIVGVELAITPVKPLYDTEDLGQDVPFLNYRM